MAADTDLPPSNIVLGVAGAEVAPNQSSVDVRFSMNGGAGLTLRMSAHVLEDSLAKLTQLNLFLQSRTPTSTGHLAVRPVDAVDATAAAAGGGAKVILSIKGRNNIDNHFAVDVSVAKRHLSELRKAIESADKQARAVRQ